MLTRRLFLHRGASATGAALAAAAIGACGGTSGSAASRSATPTTTPVTNGDDALRRLMAGNKRFVDGKLVGPGRDDVRRAEQAEGQTPFAIVVGCSDSRVPPEVVFDEGIGDLFLVRVAGNTAAAPVAVGSVEYAATTFSCPLLLVLAHENCGAVKAAIDVVKKGSTFPGSISAVADPIVPAVNQVKDQPADQLLQAAIRQNALQTLDQLQKSSAVLRDLVGSGKLKLAAAEYHLHSGAVEQLS